MDLERCLAYISSKYRAVTFGELVHMVKGKRLTPATAVVMFDDGLRSQLEVAVPLLRKYHLRATFSPIACTFAFGVMPSQYQLYYLLDNTKRKTFCFEHGSVLQEREYYLDYRGKRSITNPSSPLRRAIVGGCYSASREILQHLEEVLEVRCSPAHEMFMTIEELQALVEEGHEIAGHSVWHAQPSLVNLEEWRNELRENLETMRSMLGVDDYCFVYPYGGRKSIDHGYVDVVRTSGFVGAASSMPGINTVKTDPFRMLRLVPW